jgi:hypothetical protein
LHIIYYLKDKSMNKTTYFIVVPAMILSCFLTGAVIVSAAEQSQPLVLLNFGRNFDIDSVVTNDAKVARAASGLRIETGHEKPWPGITIKAPAGKWDLSDYETISVDVKNVADEPVTISCRVDNPGADGSKNCVTDSITLAGGEQGTLTVQIFPGPWKLSEPLELIGMRGYPVYSGKVDTSNITQILFFVTRPRTDHAFEIGNIRAGGSVTVLDAKTFFPFIDEFGQFIHRDWPGKTHSLDELVASSEVEKEDLDAHPGPPNRDKYGGWAAGPQLKATGFFRVEKYQGKWWLVDPDGRLFWSHGVDCVDSGSATPISDREKYFRSLPDENSRFAQFYGGGSWAPHGYYQNHSPYRTYDFSRANLLRKYGQDWAATFAEITHRRLKRWGMNTIANWSDRDIYLMRKTSYVCTISYSAKTLEGSEGYWGKFFDVFDPSFRQVLRKRLESEKGRSIGDPWCIGYFVHNELAWGDEVSLALATLISPADQPAKAVFVDDLKAKYTTIDNLNKTWATNYSSWDALLESRQAPDKEKAWADLTAFYTKTAETYFGIIRDELEEVAPNQLYMGCRFAWVNDRAARAAAKFCDIVSYNRYTYSVADHRLPDGIDKPSIIGEFHFGALDRGMFHTGLCKTAGQQDRADKYESYVKGALRNPSIVGTHWFQYKDQLTTGRGDGEDYQIGLIDVCDKPYPETIKAVRDVGYNLYEYRMQAK